MNCLFENSSFSLFEENQVIYVRVTSPGVTVFDFNSVLKNFPQIKVSQFAVLQNAFKLADGKNYEVGTLKLKYELEIASDDMTVYIKINVPQEEIDADLVIIQTEIIQLLKEQGVNTGILTEVLKNELVSNKKIVIARGIEPIAGEDGVCTYYELSKREAKIDETGKSDHYELNLIDNVKMGDWLGEKTLPTAGVDGLTVKGAKIPAKFGREAMLKYDRNTVDEVQRGDKFVLIAKNNGAVNFANGKIRVENHIIIYGDVDFSTGNIDFDGNITINGTVLDKFSVKATGDIEIKGKDGIGAAEKIESTNGSIYVSGGVNGKNEAVIIAKKDIFVKFANECRMIAGNSINISKYAFDSYLQADKIYLDPKKGKIVGGEINAKHKIVSAAIGNIQERQTKVNVEGFIRGNVKAELDTMQIKMSDLVLNINRMRRKLEIFEQNIDKLDERAKNTYYALLQNNQSLLDELANMSSQLEKFEDILRTRGEGEIQIHQAVYPKTMMKLKSLQKQVAECMRCSFYIKDNEIFTVD